MTNRLTKLPTRLNPIQQDCRVKRIVEQKRITGGSLQKIRQQQFTQSPLCAECAKNNRVTIATISDHLIPLWMGGSESIDNRQSLCLSCHDKKTKEEAKIRAMG